MGEKNPLIFQCLRVQMIYGGNKFLRSTSERERKEWLHVMKTPLTLTLTRSEAPFKEPQIELW